MIVDGKLVLEARRATKVDEVRVVDAAEREAVAMIARSGSEHLLDRPKGFFGKRRR